MRVVIRTDASIAIGSGHVIRCLTLADQLRSKGAEVVFLCAALPGALSDLVRSRGYRCTELSPAVAESWMTDADETLAAAAELMPGTADWLIVDHYGLDSLWEASVRACCRRLMVIDDLADRAHKCDLLLDQNFYLEFETRYIGLLPASTKCLLGTDYVLLRSEFAEMRRNLRRRDGSVRRILVFFGGSDPTNQTQCALEGINALERTDIEVYVVVGSANPFRLEIQSFCESRPWATYYCQISNMAELIAEADLGIGAGGAAMWERSALGLPTLTVVFAENQVRTTEDVAKTGAIMYLGWAASLSPSDYAEAIDFYLQRPDELASVSTKALSLIDPSSNGAELIIRAMTD